MPQMQVFFIAIPLQIVIGLGILMIALPALLSWFITGFEAVTLPLAGLRSAARRAARDPAGGAERRQRWPAKTQNPRKTTNRQANTSPLPTRRARSRRPRRGQKRRTAG